jgi:branched-chain amino acid transport system ATP-binding protein
LAPSPATGLIIALAAVSTILVLHNVSKRFGALRVTDDVTLSVAAGETLGILGPNGAGKTTLFNLITGDVRTDAGRIEFDGRDVTHEPPHRRCRLGIGRSYQIPQPFGALTVFENLVAAASFGSNQPERDTYASAVEILRATGLLTKANRLAGSLTLLDRKRLELARALAGDPAVLLLDEIAGGLTENEVEMVIATVKNLLAQGITIIWIEHIVRARLAVVSRIVAISFGRNLIEGDPNEVMCSDEVQACYMGGTPL